MRANIAAACIVATVTFGGVVGCNFGITADDFIKTADALMLGPDQTCDELKSKYGMPYVTTVADPSGIGLEFTEDYVLLSDGRSLRVWYIPADAARGVVVLSNGAVGEMACYLFLTLNLHERGWSVAMYDYTGFGGSDGDASLTTVVDDGTAAVNWAIDISGADAVILMGVSLGTIPASAYAAEYPDRVRAVILDGPISVDAEIERFNFLLAGPAAQFAALFTPALHLSETLQYVTAPVLAFLYEDDEFASVTEMPTLLGGLEGTTEVYYFENMRHVRGPYLSTDEYFDEVEDFLADVELDETINDIVDEVLQTD